MFKVTFNIEQKEAFTRKTLKIGIPHGTSKCTESSGRIFEGFGDIFNPFWLRPFY